MHDRAIAAMACNPLLLALICSLAANLPDTQPFPDNRTGLYDAVVWRLLSGDHRSADRGAQTSSIHPTERQNLLAILTRVAFTFASTERGWVDRMSYQELIATISSAGQVLADLGGSAAAVVDMLTDQAAMLVPTANPVEQKPTYTFLHRSVAEYLVACHLRDMPYAERMRVINDHLWFDPDWANVIPMLGRLMEDEHLEDARNLVLYLLSQSRDPLHWAFHTALRTLGESSTLPALISTRDSRRLTRRVTHLLARNSFVSFFLAETLAAMPALPPAVTEALLAVLSDWRHFSVGARVKAVNALAGRGRPQGHRGPADPAARRASGGGKGSSGQCAGWAGRPQGHRGPADPAARRASGGGKGSSGQCAGWAGRPQGHRGPADPAARRASGGGKGSSGQCAGWAGRPQGHRGPADPAARRASGGGKGSSGQCAGWAGRPQGHRGPADPAARRASGEVKVAAVNALAGRDDPRVTEALLTLLSDKSSRVRRAAVNALDERDDSKVIEALLIRLRECVNSIGWNMSDETLVVREQKRLPVWILWAILWPIYYYYKLRSRMRAWDIYEIELEDGLADRDFIGDVLTVKLPRADVRRTDVEMLLTQSQSLYGQRLRLALRDPATRRAAVEALAGCDEPWSTELLLSQLRDRNVSVRLDTIEALTKRQEPKVTKCLRNLLWDKNDLVSIMAAEALVQRNDQATLTWLCRLRFQTLSFNDKETCYYLASRIVDRVFLDLPVAARRHILRRLHRLTRIISGTPGYDLFKRWIGSETDVIRASDLRRMSSAQKI